MGREMTLRNLEFRSAAADQMTNGCWRGMKRGSGALRICKRNIGPPSTGLGFLGLHVRHYFAVFRDIVG